MKKMNANTLPALGILLISVSFFVGGCSDDSGSGNGAATGTGTVTKVIKAHLSVGEEHTCFNNSKGEVKCWGRGMAGETGLPSPTDVGAAVGDMGDNLPDTAFGTGLGVTKIASGTEHSCAVLDNGGVKCWGRNTNGALGIESNIAFKGDDNDMGDNLPFVNLGTGLTAKDISIGSKRSCAILNNDRLKCWGEGIYRRLGTGEQLNHGDLPNTMGDNLPYVNLGQNTDNSELKVVDIALAQESSCALVHTNDTTPQAMIKCWGNGQFGQLGNESTSSDGLTTLDLGNNLPNVNLGTNLTPVAVEARSFGYCAIVETNDTPPLRKVKCWGYNNGGQLGLGDTVNRGDVVGDMGDNLPFVDLGTNMQAQQLATGSGGVCAILTNGDLKCWGGNGLGQLGLEDNLDRGDAPGEMGDNLPAVNLGSGLTAISIARNFSTSCAVVTDNATPANIGLKCWGYNLRGRLGQEIPTSYVGYTAGSMGDNLRFTNLGTGAVPQQVAIGLNFPVCAVLTDGRAKCWGSSDWGFLGHHGGTIIGDEADEMASLQAINLGTGLKAVQTVAGDRRTCSLFSNGKVKCWGDNSGALGLEDYVNRGGDPSTLGDALPAVNLGTGRTATHLTMGWDHVCAMLDNKQIKCWGGNQFGTLGLSDTNDRGGVVGTMGDALPTVDLGVDFVAATVEAGGENTCALSDTGLVKCWGSGINDETGNGGVLGQENSTNLGDSVGTAVANITPINLGTGRTATQLTVGEDHACAILDNGDLKCWGSNFAGQLGLEDTGTRGLSTGTMGDSLPRVELGTGLSATKVVAGNGFTCALLNNGDLKCWGTNWGGQLGAGHELVIGSLAGHMGDNLARVELGTDRTVVDFDLDFGHVCAILDDDSVKCWGENSYGQLGTNNADNYGDEIGEMGDNLPAIFNATSF